ncbi:MAG: ATP-binding protein [Ilumatobacteraceae bacterium]
MAAHDQPNRAATTVSEPARPIDEVVERLPTGVVVADARGRVVYRNPAARAFAGTHVGVLIDEAIDHHLAHARAQGPITEVLELFGPPKRVVSVTALPMADGRSVAYVDDVTEQRRANQVRTDFVANVSHELRTPVGALLVLAETLVDVDDRPTTERIVTRMQAEAERASRTIDDLLELSQIESRGSPDLELIDVEDLIRDACSRVVELAAGCGVAISSRAPSESAGPFVRGDRSQLASAIGNLVENAVKYSDSGDCVGIDVRTEASLVVIDVTDDGCGIPRPDLDRVFERFYRVDRARRRTSGGTGLGLSIVRHVAQNHGGTVSVTSAEGEGSTFTVRLPAEVLVDETASRSMEDVS